MEIEEVGSKIDVKMFSSGVVDVMVELPSGCIMRLKLLGVERHALPSGVYSRTTEENEELIGIANAAVESATVLLSSINKKLSEGDFKL